MKKITFENFQAHKKTTIELADTLTAITGQSDQGKSSLIRGIRAVRDNKPRGTAFIRTGTKSALVNIDGVELKRTKNVNSYTVDGDVHKALRGAVPDEVTHALNLSPDSIQSQHDPLFLIDPTAYSPGKRAQKLSELVDLESTTRALKVIASKKRKHNSRAEVLKITIEETELQLEKLEHVNSADVELVELERTEAQNKALRVKGDQVYNAVENAVQAQIELSKIPSTDALKPAKKIVEYHSETLSMIKQYNGIDDSLAEIVSIEHLLKQDPGNLLKKARRLLQLIGKKQDLQLYLSKLKRLTNKVVELTALETTLESDKKELIGETCPLCGKSNE